MNKNQLELIPKKEKKTIEKFLKLNSFAELKNIIYYSDIIEYNCEHGIGHPIYSKINNYLHTGDICCEKIDYSYLNQK